MEIRNFACAMAAVPGARGEIIAYEPVPEWVTGLGFLQLTPGSADDEQSPVMPT
jgi:protocatechuate 4,5-dioxygenase beta chain